MSHDVKMIFFHSLYIVLKIALIEAFFSSKCTGYCMVADWPDSARIHWEFTALPDTLAGLRTSKGRSMGME